VSCLPSRATKYSRHCEHSRDHGIVRADFAATHLTCPLTCLLLRRDPLYFGAGVNIDADIRGSASGLMCIIRRRPPASSWAAGSASHLQPIVSLRHLLHSDGTVDNDDGKTARIFRRSVLHWIAAYVPRQSIDD
jgi:hypothetical protein